MIGQPGAGANRLFRMDEIDHPRVLGSVGDLVATMSEAIDWSSCFVDDEGYFELDDRAWFALAAARDPQFDWWQNDE